MAITFKLPVNLKLTMPSRLPRQLLEPILKPLWRGPKTTGTALHDRIALQKSLFVCKSCEAKMNTRHLKRLQYVELRDYHGWGLCDGCQYETACAMWMWEGSKHIQHQDAAAEWHAVLRREHEIRERWKR